MCSKFTACYGIATILDPFLLFLVDVAYHNYGCRTYDADCSTDYTSSDCSCFEGDFVKLFNRTKADEGSGITGAILIVVVYFGTVIISAFLYYEYLVYVHKDARILDLWRRIRGPSVPVRVVCEMSLAVCLAVCLSFSPFVFLTVCLTTCLSVCSSVYLPVCLYSCLNISTSLSIRLSVYLCIFIHVYLFFFVHVFTYLCIIDCLHSC